MSHPAHETPYAPPRSSLEILGPLEPARLASTGQRFLNLFFDEVIQVLLVALAAFLGLANGTGFLFSIAVSIGYYAVFEGVWGRTPGKLITGTRVVSADGRDARFTQILGRTAARMIPFDAFTYFGGRGRPNGWHDSLSGTRVVRVR